MHLLCVLQIINVGNEETVHTLTNIEIFFIYHFHCLKIHVRVECKLNVTINKTFMKVIPFHTLIISQDPNLTRTVNAVNFLTLAITHSTLITNSSKFPFLNDPGSIKALSYLKNIYLVKP